MVQEADCVLGAMGRLAMAAILAQSAWHARKNPSRHAAAVAGYKLLPYRAIPAAAWAFPLLSFAAALLLPWHETARAGLMLAMMLISLFTVAIAINLRRGRLHIDCGCGGAEGQHISRGLVIRNLVLLAMLAASLPAPVSHAIEMAPFIVALGGAGGIAALYFATTQLLANDATFRAGAARA